MKGNFNPRKPYNPPKTLQGSFLKAGEEQADYQGWIEYEGKQVWGGYQPVLHSTKTYCLTLLSYNKQLVRKTTQELKLRAIYNAKLIPLYWHKSVVEVGEPGIYEIQINKHLLNNPFSFEYTPSKHEKSGLVLFNQWHISSSTITNSFNPGETIVHAMGNYGILIEDETPTSKIMRFNSGAKPLDAPITFDDIVIRLEEIERLE